MIDENRSVKDLVRALRESPFFNVSLGSKELFHSNLLAWLGNMSDTKSGLSQVFRQVFDLSHIAGSIEGVEREKRNIDLTLKFDSGQEILVEVKVKSLPDLKQLKKYERKNPKAGKPLLLTLYDPGSEFDEFQNANFKEFGLALGKNFAVMPGYVGAIIKDYAGALVNMNLVMQKTFDFIENDDFIFFNSDGMGKELNHALHNLRLHDLVYKGMFDRLKRVLKERGFSTDPPGMEPGFAGEKRAKSEMYRGSGLVTGWYEMDGIETKCWPFSVYGGVEIQHDTYKIFVMTKTEEKIPGFTKIPELEKITEDIVEGLEKKEWFGFEIAEKHMDVEEIKRARVRIGTYQSKGAWCFKYTKKRIVGKVRMGDLANAIDEEVNKFIDKEKLFQDVVTSVLKDHGLIN